MKQLLAMERRLQDLERKFENKERYGKIVDVKFDDKTRRWFVKMNDGEDLTPSGSEQSQSGDGLSGDGSNDNHTFKSDWMPWKSFSHGTIKSSVPPKKGMEVVLRSSAGMAELATVEPYHYGPDTPSPHDKQDEIVHLIEDEDQDSNSQNGQAGNSQQTGQQEDKWAHWEHNTKNQHHVIIQKKKKDDQGSSEKSGQTSDASGSGDKPQKTRKLPEVDDNGADDTVQLKVTKDGLIATHGKSKAKIQLTGDTITLKMEGMTVTITKDETKVVKDSATLSVKGEVISGVIGPSKFVVKGKGTKIAYAEDFIAVAEGGKLFSSKPILIGLDPVGDP